MFPHFRPNFRLLMLTLLVLLITLSIAPLGSAQDQDLTAVPLAGVSAESTIIVTTEKDQPSELARTAQASQGLVAEELDTVSVIVTFDETVDVRQLEAVSGGRIIHRYETVFDGVSMVLSGDKVDDVDRLRGITGIYLDQLQQPDTEVSPGFIGAPTLWNQLGGQANAGEGVIVGVLDTGVWPEHPSFSDPDPLGNPYPQPPTTGLPCEFGNTTWNPNDAPFMCNNKLIGAYQFLDTYKAVEGGLLPTEFDSARDDNGHGTHTASTAAGNAGVAASIFGVPRGIVSGIAPRAHVIMYRVCANEGCYQSDSVAAVEQAILDGVDSINFSISGGGSPYSDIVELAFAVAYENGVFVSASAGNSGPAPETVDHRGPWTMTVGASTTDRRFISTVSLEADDGDTLTLTGASVTDGISTPTPVVFPPAGQELCLTPFAPGTFNGEIVICRRGVNARVEKSFNVAAGGGAGMLQYNPTLQGLATDNHFIPSVHLENDAGAALLDFMATHTGVMGTFTPGVATQDQGDVMAAFSSRGGPGQTLGISKPDITAPGVQILAGHTPLPATVVGGLPGELFRANEGTSMSSPHIAGAGALLRALHPDWTPGQIKSALMLTALTDGVVKEDGVTPADPFDFGSGRVDLTKAGSAGLTMDETAANYFALEDELWNANYPSLYHPNLGGSITVERTVHNETNQKRNWKLTVSAPSDLIVTVPNHVQVPANGDATFDITVDARHVPIGEVRHAVIEFKQGNNRLHFPITIVRGQEDVTIEKTCDPATISIHDTTDCTITITNNSFTDATVHLTDRMPQPLTLVNGSVVGATPSGNGLTFDGTLFAAEPPVVNVAIDPAASPAGYVPLSAFPGNVVISASDESITNVNVPAFEYAGETYSQIGIVSNGYIVVGGGTAADVEFVNSDLPDPAVPNNILAPFWTDLNPGAGGRVLANVLTDGNDTWTIIEWESVPNFGDGETNTFQVWIGLNNDANPGEDISFVYGSDISDGGGGFLTVGAENKSGNSGGTVYFDGVGTAPSPSTTGYEVDVFSTPSMPGETHIITFSARGKNVGTWTNCAEMTSNIFQGTATACFTGDVVAP